MHIDWWTLALQAINVLILVWLLARFLYRPVMKVIADRQAAAETLLSDAQGAKVAALAETAALKSRNDGFAAEAAQRRGEMQADIEKDRVRLLAQAKTDADAVATQAAAAADAERARMMVEWQDKAGLLAGSMAETLLARLPAAQTTDAMFDALLDRLKGLSEAERDKLAEDAPLALTTPAPVGEADQARYLKALEGVLPKTTVLEFAVDPSLIAGFEMCGAHMRIRNSWRADLDGMLATLKEDDHARLA
jgi:F-type H+-transporting ATPase subunit b